MHKIFAAKQHCMSLLLILILFGFNIFVFVEAMDRLVLDQNHSIEQTEANTTEDIATEQIETIDPTEDIATEQIETIDPTEETILADFGLNAAEIAINRQTSTRSEEYVTDTNTENEAATDAAYDTYRVVRGDSLYWIAKRYDTSVNELIRLNKLTSNIIHSGQELVVPKNRLKTYPVGLSLTNQEVEWIAQMIYAEARGEPYTGQVAVGAVIINRVKSSKFPSTVYEVLFQDNAFQPVRNGSFYSGASDQAYQAALDALNGQDPTKGALFFFNPKISNDRFMHNRTPVITIGQHRFTI